MWEFVRTIVAVVAGSLLTHWLTMSRERERSRKEKRLANYTIFIQAVVKEWDRLHMQAAQRIPMSTVYDAGALVDLQRHENRAEILQSMVAVALAEPDLKMRERVTALAAKVGSFNARSFIATAEKDRAVLSEVRDELSQLIKLVGNKADDRVAELWKSTSQAIVNSVGN
jgi:hypothetical protein